MLKKVFTALATIACVGIFLLISSPSASADTYYGNGLYCGKHYCHVNWGQAWQSVGHIAVNGWLEHGPWAQRP